MQKKVILKKNISDLSSFYQIMLETAPIKKEAVTRILKSENVYEDSILYLEDILQSLYDIEDSYESKAFFVSYDKTINLEFSYEIEELKRDILYLREGEDALIDYLKSYHQDFDAVVEKGVELFKDKIFSSFISDRDGTTNNYCARYNSSIQSIYNAVFLSYFFKNRVNHPIFITSAPLENTGILDVSVLPDYTVIYSASKGRRFIDLECVEHRYPVDTQKRAKMHELNEKIMEFLKEPAYKKFTLIGSGLQFKFGQTTIARQNIDKSIDPEESFTFLEEIKSLAYEIDPKQESFRIEDTGLDIEIILTIIDENGQIKDFDKGDGVKFLNDRLNLGLSKGQHMVCGDTSSDVPMLETVLCYNKDVSAIYVTKKKEFADRIDNLCSHKKSKALIVSEPDMLICILRSLGKILNFR